MSGNISIVLVFPNPKKAEEFFEAAKSKTSIDIGDEFDVYRLNEYSQQSELYHELDVHLFNTPNFEVINGQKYYPSKDIRKILDRFRRK